MTMNAGEASNRLLLAALSPLRLEPLIADKAPLLELFSQNASKLQIGASTIIQRQYRALIRRRRRAHIARFYLMKKVDHTEVGSQAPRQKKWKSAHIR